MIYIAKSSKFTGMNDCRAGYSIQEYLVKYWVFIQGTEASSQTTN